MKRWIHATSNLDLMKNYKGEFLDRTRYKGFDLSGPSDEEYYGLEDELYGEDQNTDPSVNFDDWYMSLPDEEQEKVDDVADQLYPGVQYSAMTLEEYKTLMDNYVGYDKYYQSKKENPFAYATADARAAFD